MTGHLRNARRVAAAWPVFFWSVVLILALGVGANTAAFAAVRTLLIDRPPYRDPDSLVVFRQIDHFAQVPLRTADIPALEQLEGLATVAGCSASPFPMWRNRPAVLAAPIEVTERFFELLQPVIIGTAAGLLGGLASVHIVASEPLAQTLLFKVAPTDVSTYALAITVVLANAMLACLVPLRRALRLDPATTLKSD